MISKRLALALVISLSGFLIVAVVAPHWHQAAAHKGATGPVKTRMEIMKSIQGANKTIAEMLKGKRPYDKVVLARLARDIAGHIKHLPALFPKGSSQPPSEALPAIWADWKGFTDGLTSLKEEAAKLADTAEKGTRREALLQYLRMSKTCTACHTDYRKRR